MFGSPRVIAIDDNQQHLDGLVRCLQQQGIACLPIHFTDDQPATSRCPDVRIIFADLHLVPGTSNHQVQFGNLGALLEETIVPRGPYFILLWTWYPAQAADLAAYLDDRLEKATKPSSVKALPKDDHLDSNGDVKDERSLMAAIMKLIKGQPQVGALYDWETRILSATGKVVASLLEMASARPSTDRPAEAGRILRQLGMAAVGDAHVDTDRFRAVNEALLPILADRIAGLRSEQSNADVWQAAFDAPSRSQSLTSDEAARLNSMVHLDTDTRIPERGVVVPRLARLMTSFDDNFGIGETDAAKKQFQCSNFMANDKRFRWVLVQAQAACDYAQARPGPAPCYLGLEMPFKKPGSSQPAALWTSPALDLGGEVRQLRVSAAFPVSIGPYEFSKEPPIYRLREQILNDLIYHLHSHGARPGMLSFRGA